MANTTNMWWFHTEDLFDEPVDPMFDRLMTEVPWERRESAPRSESWQVAPGRPLTPYTYGRGRGERTYVPVHYVPIVQRIASIVEDITGEKFDGCFLNRYDNGGDHLGWHADDSPEMDDARSIPIVSFGATRAIQFRLKDPAVRTGEMGTVQLRSGSLLVMPPGFQDQFEHRIPRKLGTNEHVGTRISLTFRGLVS